MDEQNVFSQGVDYLIQARDAVAAYDQKEFKRKRLADERDKINKAMSQEEKSIKDEINSTVKKRKSELENEYDTQLVAARKQVKGAQGEKDKKKSEKVQERKSDETADVRASNVDLKNELKTLFKKNHVPFFCNSGFYFSLFSPKGVKEFLVLIISFAVGLAGIPCLMYLLFSKVIIKKPEIAEAPWLMALVIALCIIIFLALYFLIFNVTKVRHKEVIAEGRKIRDQIVANNKNVRAIENAISKDKDESMYGLEAYDEKIQSLQSEVDRIAGQKQDALKEFEKVTKGQITDEIMNRRQGKVEELKAQHADLKDQVTGLEGQLKEASLYITDNYTKYLGKSICKREVLEDLINMMESEGVATVSEALAIYKGEAPHPSDVAGEEDQ